jgi:hypothetical protein
MELNKVREAAAKQANVLKRKATEAVAKQRSMAEARKRKAVSASANTASAATIEKGRKGDLVSWLEKEVEIMAQVRATKEQLDEQATLRAAAAKKREGFVGQKGLSLNKVSEASANKSAAAHQRPEPSPTRIISLSR